MKKKKFFSICSASLMLMAAVWCGIQQFSTGSSRFSFLTLSNVTSLASNESGADECYNGGRGAISCTISPGTVLNDGSVSTGCSVTCGGNYYACCGRQCTCKSYYGF